MKNEKICLIGCGWLGKPLALHLIAAGYSVTATTAHNKSSEFKSDGIPYIQFDIASSPEVPDEIINADVLIYTIPPLELTLVKSFFDKIADDKKILFTTSTSVYGKNLGDVDETFEIKIEQTNSALLVETEKFLRSRFTNLTIIRPGGLYGGKRHPIYFLQGKKDLKTGHELLHLVHFKDCIKAIETIVKKDIWNETFNLVSNLSIPKRDYYTTIAAKHSLPLPEYSDLEDRMVQTRISNEKSKKLLKIDYLDPNDY